MDKRPRVAAKRLGSYIDKRVTMIGMITKISASRKHLEVNSPENMKINISLPDEFVGDVGSLIEIHGTVLSKATIAADSYITFNNEEAADFDADMYNEFLTIRDFKLGQSEYLAEAFPGN